MLFLRAYPQRCFSIRRSGIDITGLSSSATVLVCRASPSRPVMCARTVAHPGHLATPRAAVPPPPAPHRRPAYQTGPTAPCAAFSAVRAGSGVLRGLVESRFGPTNPPCTVVQTFPAVSVWSAASC